MSTSSKDLRSARSRSRLGTSASSVRKKAPPRKSAVAEPTALECQYLINCIKRYETRDLKCDLDDIPSAEDRVKVTRSPFTDIEVSLKDTTTLWAINADTRTYEISVIRSDRTMPAGRRSKFKVTHHWEESPSRFSISRAGPSKPSRTGTPVQHPNHSGSTTP